MPVSVRVKTVLAALNISGDETNAVDDVIAMLGSNPLVSMATGKELKNLHDVAEFIANPDIQVTDEIGTKIRNFLSIPDVRKGLATFLIGKMKESKNPEILFSVLEKVSNAPIDGFGNTAHSSPEDFVERGLIPYLAQFIPSQEEMEPVRVHMCPFCQEIFQEQ